jgi:hypothetical protein
MISNATFNFSDFLCDECQICVKFYRGISDVDVILVLMGNLQFLSSCNLNYKNYYNQHQRAGVRLQRCDSQNLYYLHACMLQSRGCGLYKMFFT